MKILKGFQKDYSTISDCLEKLMTSQRADAEIKIDKLLRVQRVNVTVIRREAIVTIRNMEGTLKCKVPQLDRKIKIKDLLKGVVDTEELKRNSTKANGFRKTVCDILR